MRSARQLPHRVRRGGSYAARYPTERRRRGVRPGHPDSLTVGCRGVCACRARIVREGRPGRRLTVCLLRSPGAVVRWARPPTHLTRRGDGDVSMTGKGPIITVQPGTRGGRPTIRGLRITVYDVLSYLASGMSTDEVLREFPTSPPRTSWPACRTRPSGSGGASPSREAAVRSEPPTPPRQRAGPPTRQLHHDGDRVAPPGAPSSDPPVGRGSCPSCGRAGLTTAPVSPLSRRGSPGVGRGSRTLPSCVRRGGGHRARRRGAGACGGDGGHGGGSASRSWRSRVWSSAA